MRRFTRPRWLVVLLHKPRERAAAEDPVEPFIDRDGYLRFVDSTEERFREVLADQQQRP